MIRKMRAKFIAITMAAIMLLLLAIFLTINIFMTSNVNDQVDEFLRQAMENDGRVEHSSDPGIPGNPGERDGSRVDDISEREPRSSEEPPDLAPPLFIDSVSFLMSEDGVVLETIHNSEGMSDEKILSYGQYALFRDDDSGSIDGYKYRLKEKGGNWIIVFANTEVQDEMLSNLWRISSITSAISVVLLLGMVIFLSKYVTGPVEMAFEKQKRFISDSSHELKTPLSIMSANLDMLQMELGDNDRVNAIQDGVHRMNGLIHELLTLVRTEQSTKVFSEVNLSDLMEGVILPLEVIAFEKGKMIAYNVEEDIKINGDEEGLRKMINALMDNAIKYAKEDTTIQAALYRKNGHTLLEVFNEGIGVTMEQKAKLFDKFYRVDDARQRTTGGYGIGLSIVQSVVESHKGKIDVESVPEEYIVFRVTLP